MQTLLNKIDALQNKKRKAIQMHPKKEVNVIVIATKESSRLQFLEECGEWKAYKYAKVNKL
jgi:hypothetical protein